MHTRSGKVRFSEYLRRCEPRFRSLRKAMGDIHSSQEHQHLWSGGGGRAEPCVIRILTPWCSLCLYIVVP